METEVLPCGCEKTLIGYKWVWVHCDEHEEEDVEEIRTANKDFKMFFRRE